jgi:hypothetical protein
MMTLKMDLTIVNDKQRRINQLLGLFVILLMAVISLSMIFSSPVAAGEVENNTMVNLKQGDGSNDTQALGIKIEEIAGNKVVGLRRLGNKFNWRFGFQAEDKTVVIYGAKGEGQLNIAKAQYNDRKLVNAPFIRDGRTYISFNLLKKMMVDLENIELELLATLNIDKTVVKKNDKIEAEIELYNISDDKVRINYPSGQLYDLYLIQGQEEVWRWSNDKFFTMALMYKDLKPGARLHYQEEIILGADNYQKGEYILSGELKTKISIPLPKIKIEVE